MNESLKSVLNTLLIHRKIGESHTPEEPLINKRTKYLSKPDRKEFEDQYFRLIKEGFIIRLKKKTGKGSDWHISLNPKLLTELRDKMN